MTNTPSTKEELPNLEALGQTIEFSRHPEGKASIEPLLLKPETTTKDLKRIVDICNQPLVHEELKARIGDRIYTPDDAEEFIKFAKDGWDNGTHFVYAIRDKDAQIVSCADIKSNNLDSAELGCWADTNPNNRGYMTNVFKVMIEIAKKAGYRNLFATTRPENTLSQNLMNRVGFRPDGKDEKGYPRFTLDLN